MNIFSVDTGELVTVTSNLSVDGWPTGERVTYTAVATDEYSCVNGEETPRRKFANVTPRVHGSDVIWLGERSWFEPAIEERKQEPVERRE